VLHTPWNDVVTLKPGVAAPGAMTVQEQVDVTLLPKPSGASTKPSSVYVRFPKKSVKQKDANGAEVDQPITVLRDGVAVRETEIPKDWLVTVEGSAEPKVQIGLRNLMRNARPGMLLGAWALLCIPFVVSAWRWQKLMEPQGIRLPFKKCLALTFVGQFYSTFLPGITGGDLVKIIYTSRVVGSKTKAAITVLLDRVIGLIALVVIAGIAAACQVRHNPIMWWVMLGIAGALGALVLFSVIYFSHRLRRLTGLAWILNHSKVPAFVKKADDVLHAYRGAWPILLQAFIASLITQVTVPISAFLAGKAFGIPVHPGYYLAYVPLAILAASVPISPPQGFGVTEWVLFNLFTGTRAATASQTFALAQAIRFLPILWNLVGAFWVVTGKYSRHQAVEEEKAAAVPTQ
jgi:uncharacterized protein (TIRG00374 family)